MSPIISVSGDTGEIEDFIEKNIPLSQQQDVISASQNTENLEEYSKKLDAGIKNIQASEEALKTHLDNLNSTHPDFSKCPTQIELTILKCIETEDFVGRDDLLLVISPDKPGDGVMKGSLNNGEIWRLNRVINFESEVKIELIEQDDNDSNDKLGNIKINNNKLQGTDKFREDGSHYEIYWVPGPDMLICREAVKTEYDHALDQARKQLNHYSQIKQKAQNKKEDINQQLTVARINLEHLVKDEESQIREERDYKEEAAKTEESQAAQKHSQEALGEHYIISDNDNHYRSKSITQPPLTAGRAIILDPAYIFNTTAPKVLESSSENSPLALNYFNEPLEEFFDEEMLQQLILAIFPEEDQEIYNRLLYSLGTFKCRENSEFDLELLLLRENILRRHQFIGDEDRIIILRNTVKDRQELTNREFAFLERVKNNFYDYVIDILETCKGFQILPRALEDFLHSKFRMNSINQNFTKASSRDREPIIVTPYEEDQELDEDEDIDEILAQTEDQALDELSIVGQYMPDSDILQSLFNKLPYEHQTSLGKRVLELEDKVKAFYILKALLYSAEFLTENKFDFEELDTIVKQALVKALYSSSNLEEINKFRIALAAMEYKYSWSDFSYDRDKILVFLIKCKKIHGLMLKDVTKIIDTFSTINLPLKLLASRSLTGNFKFIKKSIIQQLLTDLFAQEVINIDVTRATLSKLDAIVGTDLSLAAKILTRIEGLKSLEDLNELLSYLLSNSLSIHALNHVLSSKFEQALQEVISFKEVEAAFRKYESKITYTKLSDLYDCLNYIIVLGGIKSEQIKQDNIYLKNLFPYIISLFRNEWSIDSVSKLLSYIIESNKTFFPKILEVISLYHLKADDKNISNQDIFTLIDQYSSKKLISEITKLARESHFGTEDHVKDLAEIFEEALGLNLDNPNISQALRSDSLKKQFEEIEEFSSGKKKSFLCSRIIDKDSRNYADNVEGDPHKEDYLFLFDKSINDWSEDEIKKWRNLIKNSDISSNLSEVITVVKRGVFLTNNISLRNTQILSVILLLERDRRLLEIKTGEGKCTITAVSAVILGLMDLDVDVFSSSPVLAKNDMDENRRVYELFGLEVACNIDAITDEDKKLVYSRGKGGAPKIVYGDASTFIADRLKHESYGNNILANRRQESIAVILDETDYALIDQKSSSIMLSQHIPSFEYFTQFMLSIWQLLMQIDSRIKLIDSRLYYIPNDYNLENCTSDSCSDITDDHDFRLRNLISNVRELAKSSQSLQMIPEHLHEFLEGQVENWSESAIKASLMKENEIYIIKEVDSRKK